MTIPIDLAHRPYNSVRTNVLHCEQGCVVSEDKVEGHPICQVCVPESKHVQVLNLTHDSVFG